MPAAAADPRAAAALAIGGFQAFSVTDWPDHLAAVVFTQGCALRCGYCHNPHLIPRGAGAIPFDAVVDHLRARGKLLDGVVFSGGEPCLQPGLPAALDAVRAIGLKTALHTAGTHPHALARVLDRVDWVGIDLKAPPDQFVRVAGADASRRLWQSVDALVASGVSFEARTTWHPDLFSANALFDLAQMAARHGVAHYALQCMRTPSGDGTRWLPGPPPPADCLEALRTLFRRFDCRR